MATNIGRRPPVDFPDSSGLSAGNDGANDRKKGEGPVQWTGALTGHQKGTVGNDWDGSYITVDSAGRRNGRQSPPQSV